MIFTKDKILKYAGIFSISLLLTPFGGFMIMAFPLSGVPIIIAIYSIFFSQFIVKNKILLSVVLLNNVSIILCALIIDVYFIVTGGNVIGL